MIEKNSHSQVSITLAGQEILLLGGGVTGRALANFLKKHQINFLIFDEKSDQSFEEIINERGRAFNLAVVSPGWRKDHFIIKRLRDLKIEIISEIDFAWRMKCILAPDQQWIAVTGTNGKTTTVQMIESIFRVSGTNAIASGNVGRTVIESIEGGYKFLAVEISSFQIDWSDEAQFLASAILNIAEDHIDWHGSFESYRDAKLKLGSLSKITLFNEGDSTMKDYFSQIFSKGNKASTVEISRFVPFHLKAPGAGEIGIVENLIVDRAFVEDSSSAQVLAELNDLSQAAPHNFLNATAAAALCKYIGISSDWIRQGLQNFRIDHHRLELIAECNGVSWINDSKATNPHAALAAITSYQEVIWIAGGLAKGASMDHLVEAAHHRIKAAILIGRDAPLIKSALLRKNSNLKIIECSTALKGAELMDQVVHYATALASKGQVVLLAPACASMDQFTSYSERGELFAQSVRNSLSENFSAEER